jgi:superfamily II DNA or RNA helicase
MSELKDPHLTAAMHAMTDDLDGLKRRLLERINRREGGALGEAQAALQSHPSDPELLLMAALVALFAERPELSLRYEHRFSKRFRPIEAEGALLRAIALAQQERWAQAAQVMKQHGGNLHRSFLYLPGDWALRSWVHNWLDRIERAEKRRAAATPAPKRVKNLAATSARSNKVSKGAKGSRAAARDKEANASAISADAVALPSQTTTPELVEESQPLPRIEARIPVAVTLPESFDVTPAESTGGANAADDLTAFRLRYELSHLGLLQGFDELLCLPTLHNVEAYWYQTEAVRKVLKQFRGRVLLADEVGLGKTVEAGMALKEYLLRGMARRVLILTPATLVGQWEEEMRTKFEVEFATSYDPLLRRDAVGFWAQPRVIASIATARRAEHFPLLAAQNYDLVIVDEAHHLKNRQTQNWKLVNALQKRFLLLLSATPVQNSLVELYNLLTLLKPGIFKTEKEFRQSYMTKGKPRVPANRERMRDLMRDVMIRNTRSLVDVRLPPRHAVTVRLDPAAEEAEAYAELNRLVQETYAEETTAHRLALRHLLSSAGSTPATAARAITRFAAKSSAVGNSKGWRELADRYEALAQSGPTVKEKALLELLGRNAEEKKIVFVHHHETLERLSHLLEKEAAPFVRFEGAMSGPEKDTAIARFQAETPLLLSTESGGEGRNLQFCNTLINFDLPWNPMAIEQRIGRIHRIGQTREVFIFNTIVVGTLEEQVLHVLDEKINMFELVVGEIGQILGEMDDEGEFAETVFKAWVETTVAEREHTFAQLGERMAQAKQQYDSVKQLDEELFGDEFVAG